MEASYQKLSTGGSNMWLFNSVISCVILATGSFLIGLNGLDPYLGKLMVSLGSLITGLLCVIYSSLFQKPCLSFKLEPGFFPSILSGSFVHFGSFSLVIGFKYDPENNGIISIMVIGSAIIGAGLSFLIYNEKLEAFDILGMGISISGLVVIGIYSNGESQNSSIGFTCGLCAMGFFALRSLASRKAERSGIDLFKSSMISVFSEAFTGFLNIAIICFFVDIFQDAHQVWISLIGGVFFAIGSVTLSLAIMAGKMGPAVVIANCLGVLQMGMDYVFRGITPDGGKMVGGFIALFGVMVLLLWKDVLGKGNK
jgi:drug/metabolite transporter (DMT)-like permease